MRLTRRGWGTAFAGLLLVVLGVVLERPIILVGGAVIGAGLLGAAVAFVRHVGLVIDGLAIDQRTERDRVVADRALAVTLTGSLGFHSPLELAIESRPPASTAAGEADRRRIDIPAGAERAEGTFLAAWPHAATVRFDPPAVTARDRQGLFELGFAAGPTPTVTVVPPAPREIHVGVGGEPIAAGYGEHGSGRAGAGLEPAELREYVPGDAATRIDWKATARLAEPYIREFEIETDRRTVLVVDHGAALGSGPAGETALDYLREVALAYLANARAFDDPLGCYTVGDAGLTGRWLPAADRDQFARIERRLGELVPTDAPTEATATDGIGPAQARRLADRLESDDTPFATTLGPFFEAGQPYVERIEREPVYRTVRMARETLQGGLWTVLFTDDTDPGAVRQAVSTARRGDGRVVVYLAPSVLFEPGGLGDLDAAYDRYRDFESFRRELSRPDDVAAYEVAPGDRLEAVLASGRQRRRRGASAGGA